MAGRVNLEEQLRRAILDAPMSRYALAKRSGVSEGVISNFMSGRRTVTLRTAAKLADVLGLDLKRTRPAKKGG